MSVPNDPLLLKEPLEHRVQLPVLGLPVRFATNDAALLEAVEDVFGHWRGADADASASPGPATDIRLYLQEGDEGEDEPLITYRAPDPMRWIAHSPGSFALADLERRVGVAYVTRALMEDRARFRVSILHFLVLIIITRDDRTPVHASMIGRGDAGLLLAGPTGSGKSTLAYAASKAGLDVFSDDAAYVQLEPRRVWGAGPGLLLLRDSAQRWSELAGRPTTLFPTGKHKMTVSPRAAGKRWVSKAGVCLLGRSQGPVQVSRVGPDEIRAILTYDQSGAGVRFGPRLAEAAAWLASTGGWRLSLSADPTEAIPHLEQMLKDM